MNAAGRHPELVNERRTNFFWEYFAPVLSDIYTDFDVSRNEEDVRNLYVAAGEPDTAMFSTEFQGDIALMREDGFPVGRNEKTLLDFLHREAKASPLFFVGRLGTGKTTALKYFFEIMQKRLRVTANSLTVMVDANPYAERLRDGELTVEEAICEKIETQVEGFFSDSGFIEDLWDFIGRHVKCFAHMSIEIQTFMSTVEDTATAQRYVADKHEAFMERNRFQFLYGTLLFLHLERGIRVQVVIDNVDVLSTDLQIAAAALARTIAEVDEELYDLTKDQTESVHRHGVKCVLAVRTPGARNLRKTHLATLDMVRYVEPVSLGDVVRNRVAFFLAQEETQKKLEAMKAHPLTHRGWRFNYEDMHRTLESLNKTLVGSYTLRVLGYLSNGSVRAAMAYCGRFLCSHVVPHRYLHPAMFALHTQSDELPPFLFMRALVLGDRVLYQEAPLGVSVPNILNMFLPTPRAGSDANLLAGLRVLRALSEVTDGGTLIPLASFDTIKDIYPDLNLDELLSKWVQYGLIESPEACLASDFGKIKNIRITACGGYYLSDLVPSLSYCECVKDACDTGDLKLKPLAHCENIEEVGRATLEFLDWLLAREQDEIERVDQMPPREKAIFTMLAGSDPCVIAPLAEGIELSLTSINRAYPSIPLDEQVDQARRIANECNRLQERYDSVLAKRA